MLEKGKMWEIEKTVLSSETAMVVGSGGLEVFATPSLIAFMEKAAFLCVEDLLEDGFSTVGISVNTKHLKANLVGDQLKCVATLTEIDGKKLYFEIVVTHNETIIGSCSHERFIVNKEKFIERLKKR